MDAFDPSNTVKLYQLFIPPQTKAEWVLMNTIPV